MKTISQRLEEFDILVKGIKVFRGEEKDEYLEISDMHEIKSFLRQAITDAVMATKLNKKPIFKDKCSLYCDNYIETNREHNQAVKYQEELINKVLE